MKKIAISVLAALAAIVGAAVLADRFGLLDD